MSVVTYLTDIWEEHKSNIICTICGIFFGAISGHVLDVPFLSINSAVIDKYCAITQHVEKGRRLRMAALSMKFNSDVTQHNSAAEIFDRHREANVEFQAAADCGDAAAKAYLGQAYCFGWGIEKSGQKGLNLIREAVTKDTSFAEWQTNPIYCHD